MSTKITNPFAAAAHWVRGEFAKVSVRTASRDDASFQLLWDDMRVLVREAMNHDLPEVAPPRAPSSPGKLLPALYC